MRDAAAISPGVATHYRGRIAAGWSAERVLCHIKRTDSVVVTARIPGRPPLAGFAIMQFGDDPGPPEPAGRGDHRTGGAGSGRQLMNWLHESALVAGTVLLGLELRVSNAGAPALLRIAQLPGRQLMRGYYQGIEDALRMSRDLRVDRSLTA